MLVNCLLDHALVPARVWPLIEPVAEGYSLESFAGVIGVAASTVWKWNAEIKEFSEAVNIGRAKAALAWEKRLAEFLETFTRASIGCGAQRPADIYVAS